MAFQQNLGRVKGDKGTAYIPQITIRDGKQYISYISNDGTAVPASLSEQEFVSSIYVPYINEEGHLIFRLQNDADEVIDVGDITGPPGHSTIGTKVVLSEPVYEELPTDEQELIDDGKSLIYIISSDEAYLDVGIFQGRKFLYLENKIRFNEYRLVEDSYSKSETYSKSEISTQLGNIERQQQAISNMLGDVNSIIIQDDH